MDSGVPLTAYMPGMASTLRATVLMKTDISGSTPRFRALPETDLHQLLTEHRALVSRHASEHGGVVIRGAGDGFWLEFPSVTAAARAAMAMQAALRLEQPNRGDDRLAIRNVIALGDVSRADGELVGDILALITRIETVTPPDSIYLSAGAWLAINQAEVRTAFVSHFDLKGFDAAVPVYRVVESHRTHIYRDLFVLISDLRAFSRVAETVPLTTVEEILDALLDTVDRVTRQFDGTVRFSSGDGHCLTFAAADRAIGAAESLAAAWHGCAQAHGSAINIGLHQGTLHAFRSFLYGEGLNIAHAVQEASSAVLAPDEGGVFVTDAVRRSLTGLPWHNRLVPVAVKLPRPRHAAVEIYRLTGSAI
jgi:class 3 adenylate cyclase